jgi:thymidylate synthase
VCRALYLYGDDVTTRGLKVRELTNVQLELKQPRARIASSKVRKMSMRYMVGELCFYLNKSTRLEDIAYYGSFWRRVSDDGETVRSAYGNRLFNGQFKYAIDCLFSDKYSRKAVMSIYAASDAVESKDNPCTIALQLLIRRDKLDCYAFMRSNDGWLGLPYDLAFFTIVQEMALVVLQPAYPGLTMGSYFHHATSLHCYDEHVDALWPIAEERGLTSVDMPEMTKQDVTEWFSELLMWEQAYREDGKPPLPFNVLLGMQGWLAQWLK